MDRCWEQAITVLILLIKVGRIPPEHSVVGEVLRDKIRYKLKLLPQARPLTIGPM